MSGSIKLKHASGNGVIIAAPSSNPAADRTLTLPSDADGTIVSKDTSNNLAEIASINGGALGTKNLVINGAMQVAQRGTSSTTGGISTVDRFSYGAASGTGDEAPTQAQADVASGTTPYTLGFRKSYKATNGNQTSGAQANSLQQFSARLEAQDIANSGWNYTDSNSFITLSFWVKSSVSQNFYGFVNSTDGTSQQYPFETGTLTANTWTKITKVIPGNSNLQFDNNNDVGLRIYLGTYFGTDYTNNSVSLNAWTAYSGSARTPDFPSSSWFTTNDATFELTGVQLEVGSTASSFVHELEQETLTKCQRYFWTAAQQLTATQTPLLNMSQYNSTTSYGVIHFPTEMRAAPTLSVTVGTSYYAGYGNNSSTTISTFSMPRVGFNSAELSAATARGQGNSVFVRTNAQGAKVSFSAEI